MTLLQYYLYANLYLVLFWIGYRICLKNSVNFRVVRTFLTGSVLLAIILPFTREFFTLATGTFKGAEILSNANLPILNFIHSEPASISSGNTTSFPVQPEILLLILLATGSFLTLVRNFLRHLRIKAIILRSGIREVYGTGNNVCFSDEVDIPFIYHKYIVLPEGMPQNDRDLAIRHEQLHFMHKHHLDNLIYMVLHPFFWMNPFYLLLRKELKLNHEYQVDNSFVASGPDATFYKLSLVRYSVGTKRFNNAIGMAGSNIRKRLQMMNSQKMHPRKWKNLFSIPLTILLILSFNLACNSEKNQEIPEQKVSDKETLQSDTLDVELIDFDQENLPLPEDVDAIVVLINKLNKIMINGDLIKAEDARSKIISEYLLILERYINKTFDDDRGIQWAINYPNIQVYVQKDVNTDSLAYAALLDDIGMALYQVRNSVSNMIFNSDFNALTDNKSIERLVPMRIYTVVPDKNMSAGNMD